MEYNTTLTNDDISKAIEKFNYCKNHIFVYAPVGSVVTAACGSTLLTSPKMYSNLYAFNYDQYGTWTITISNGTTTSQETVLVNELKDYYIGGIAPEPPEPPEPPVTTYTITFKDGASGAVFPDQVYIVEEGSSLPNYSPPSRSGYYFNGWTPTPVLIVTSNATYTATWIATELNNNSWATIKAIAEENEGSNYWSVGDTKEIIINGTINKVEPLQTPDSVTFNNLHMFAFIIGFDHNSVVEGNGIHFQIGRKVATQSQYFVGFFDVTNAGNFFAFNYSNNTGDWGTCDLRQILGQDKSTANTFLSCLPSDLKNVLKTIKKYYNVGDSTPTQSLHYSNDYVFILSVKEMGINVSQENRSVYSYYTYTQPLVRYCTLNGTIPSNQTDNYVVSRDTIYSSYTGYENVSLLVRLGYSPPTAGYAYTPLYLANILSPCFVVG